MSQFDGNYGRGRGYDAQNYEQGYDQNYYASDSQNNQYAEGYYGAEDQYEGYQDPYYSEQTATEGYQGEYDTTDPAYGYDQQGYDQQSYDQQGYDQEAYAGQHYEQTSYNEGEHLTTSSDYHYYTSTGAETTQLDTAVTNGQFGLNKTEDHSASPVPPSFPNTGRGQVQTQPFRGSGSTFAHQPRRGRGNGDFKNQPGRGRGNGDFKNQSGRGRGSGFVKTQSDRGRGRGYAQSQTQKPAESQVQNKVQVSETAQVVTGQFGLITKRATLPTTNDKTPVHQSSSKTNNTVSGQFGAKTVNPGPVSTTVIQPSTPKPGTTQANSTTTLSKPTTSQSVPATSANAGTTQAKAGSSPLKPDTSQAVSGTTSLKPGTSQANSGTSQTVAAKKEEEEEDDDSSDEDTDFCKYCKLNFSTPKAYHAHTRGLQHTTLVMQAKSEKGDIRFQKEIVDASVLEVHIPAPKPAEPEQDEEDVEENWMDLDEDVIKYVKEKQNPDNRDLNPYEVGRAPSEDFNCALCNIKCTGAAAFKMHIEGKQHKSNIEAAKAGARLKRKKQQPSTGVIVETKDRESKFNEIIKDNKAPLLGLEYITEFQKSDIKAAPRYVCNLCESKCDSSTVVPHIVGLKHRLKYLQIKKPLMYEHLTKYNSAKKKKSVLNASLEDFAYQIEEELGRGDVKVKVELEDFDDEDQLKESMIRHSRALAEKVKELKEGKDEFSDDDVPDFKKANTGPPPTKKPRVPERDPYPEHDTYSRDPDNRNIRRRPVDDNERRRPVADDERRRPGDDYAHSPYDDYRRPPPRRPGYEDPRDPYSRGRYPPEDFRATYRDRFDPYRRDDPMYERRMFEERRRLDDLLLERHRLSDPYAERRRIDDIMLRRRYLDDLERDRLRDIMERRKRLQENDVDYLRLQRFADRETTTTSSGISTEEKKRLDDVLARREALKTESQADLNKKEVQAIQNKLAELKSKDPSIAAEQERAAKALKEEAAKNPNINIGEVMSSLSSSMIATEDDAAMALQISNALTQALLKYRLQNATKELSSTISSLQPMLEQKKQEPSIPGLGTGSTYSSSASNVLSFLRSPQETTPNSYASPSQPYASPAQTYTSTPQAYASPAQTYTSTPQANTSTLQAFASTAQNFLSSAQSYTSPMQYNYYQGGSANASQSNAISVPSQTQPSMVPAPPHVLISSGTTQSANKPIDTKNVDQPQKLLLDSIRRQTELLKQKIAASTAALSGSASTAVNSASQAKHTHAHNPANTYATTSRASAPNSANQSAQSQTSLTNDLPAIRKKR